jgi:hypothetical protein
MYGIYDNNWYRLDQLISYNRNKLLW